jgi:hypothetical protein
MASVKEPEPDYTKPGTDPPIPEQFRAAVLECVNLDTDGKLPVVPVHFQAPEPRKAFVDAFERLGGVPRLVMWGHENYGAFMQLYSKMVANGAQINVGGSKIELNLSWLTPERLSSIAQALPAPTDEKS